MKIHELSVSGAIASLNGDAHGLGAAEAERRLREYGPNRVEELPREPAALRFLKELTHLFALVLWVAAALAFLAAAYDPGQGMAKVGYAVIAVIVVSAVFSFWQEYRAERTLAALQKLLPQQVKALRDGRIVQLALPQLVPGDIIFL